MKKLNASTFTFRIPNSLRSNLEDIATDNEVTLSELIRYGLKNLVNNEQKQSERKDIYIKRMDGF